MTIVTCDAEDRISNLSEDLINTILEKLTVQDVVRTSILAKRWRYRWTTMRALVLDKQFFQRFRTYGAFGHNGFVRIINHVIIFHNGPISKFVLHIPNVFLDSFQEIDQWLLFLSRKGVQELKLANSNRRYKLPSYVFSCLQLRILRLENCIFKPPHDLQEFLYLQDLFLRKIEFGANSYGTQFNLPQLLKLTLKNCTNVCTLNIKAPRLQCLAVQTCPPDAILLPSLQSECLTWVLLYSKIPIEGFPQVERMNRTRMLSYLHNIVDLRVDGYYLKLFMADKIPEQLPQTIHCLKSLHIITFNFCDLDQCHGAVYLLQNFTRLDVLQLKMGPHVMHYYDMELASNYLDTLDALNLTLKELRIVEFIGVEGSRPEVLFIKLLLAHSPSLEKMTIQPSTTTDAHKRFNIAKDVMQFPRASPKAQMLYLDPKPSLSKGACGSTYDRSSIERFGSVCGC